MSRTSINPQCPRCKVRHSPPMHKRDEPEEEGGIITLVCLACDEQTSAPDKGMGRANLAAWRTRHQHRTERAQ